MRVEALFRIPVGDDEKQLLDRIRESTGPVAGVVSRRLGRDVEVGISATLTSLGAQKAVVVNVGFQRVGGSLIEELTPEEVSATIDAVSYGGKHEWVRAVTEDNPW